MPPNPPEPALHGAVEGTELPPDSPLSEVSISTIDSWELPLTQTITSMKPLRTQVNGVNMTFELEGKDKHKRGKVSVTNAPKLDGRTVRHTVDVSKMRVGEEKVFARPDGEDDVVLNLSNGERRGMTQVVMRWADSKPNKECSVAENPKEILPRAKAHSGLQGSSEPICHISSE